MMKGEVKAKEANAIAARERFMATLHEVQHRLSPKVIASDVKTSVREKADGAIAAAKDGIAHAATHPSTIAAVTIPLLVYLFRRPLANGLNAIFAAEPEEPTGVQPYEAARTQPPPIHDEVVHMSPRRASLTEQGV